MNMTLPEWKTPEECCSGLWKRIPGYIKLTFAAAVVLGFGTHLYMFANKLTNHDDIGHLFSADYGTASGRWFLPTVLGLDGPFSTPWLIGVLSILCLAVTACAAVWLLRVRRPLGCIVTAALMVAFPTVTATFSYMFTADAYFFSLMLAALGACAAVGSRWGSVPGAVAITLSMGIYQSYFGVAAALMVGALLFETLDGRKTFQELFWKGIRLAATLAVSLAAYMALVRITSRQVGLVDYMGISDMGKLSLRELPQLIFLSYGRYFTFFLRDDLGYHFGFLRYAFIAAALCAAALGVLLLRERRLGPARTALAVGLALVYPLAGNLIQIMVPGGEIHMLMLYGLVLLLVIPVGLADYMEGDGEKAAWRPFQAAAGWVILVTLALTAYSYMITANEAYLKIDLSMRQCTAYSTRLLDKIECCEGYRQGMPVVLVGSSVAEEELYPTPELKDVDMTGVFDLAAFRANYTYGYFLRYYLGFTGEIYLGDSDMAQALAETEGVRAMPRYPEAGGIQVMDGMVVVKLNG